MECGKQKPVIILRVLLFGDGIQTFSSLSFHLISFSAILSDWDYQTVLDKTIGVGTKSAFVWGEQKDLF